MNVKKLQEPFDIEKIKQRVGTVKTDKTQAMVLNYIDSRDVMDRLDEVIGSENWQDEFYEVKNNLFCKIGIKLGDEWVWKGDVGTESNTETVKGESSDAFKRAAVKWGIGRFLYDIPSAWLNVYLRTDGKVGGFDKESIENYKKRLGVYLKKEEPSKLAH